MPSLDVVSAVNRNELRHAVDQANCEIDTRYDFSPDIPLTATVGLGRSWARRAGRWTHYPIAAAGSSQVRLAPGAVSMATIASWKRRANFSAHGR
ncbi:DUF520 family protein [Acidihalobacter ferrooxydans]|uniref:Uncharacterized protein n=1 Tax=Acidihalobacter ferrooxydans TaxID=1765967 RepID=A0A1P8UIG9_9GAMM|nr:hypothetical protein BW247_11485 [Acidihalobacter ferrooxydans]